MLNEHAKLGIAQITFYIPAIAIAFYLLFFRHGKPHMAWILLFAFSLVRLAGGIVVILLNFHPSSVGLIIAAIALLGAGVFPLIVATLGLLRIITNSHFRESSKLRTAIIITRLLFGVGVIAVVAGASLEGQYDNANLSATGLKLVKAGYIIVLTIFVLLIGFEAYFWKNRNEMAKTGHSILKATCAAMPFIAVRIAYALVSVFGTGGLYSKWSNLYGSVAAYVIMGLITEYVVMLIYLGVGMRIPPSKRVGQN